MSPRQKLFYFHIVWKHESFSKLEKEGLCYKHFFFLPQLKAISHVRQNERRKVAGPKDQKLMGIDKTVWQSKVKANFTTAKNNKTKKYYKPAQRMRLE